MRLKSIPVEDNSRHNSNSRENTSQVRRIEDEGVEQKDIEILQRKHSEEFSRCIIAILSIDMYVNAKVQYEMK